MNHSTFFMRHGRSMFRLEELAEASFQHESFRYVIHKHTEFWQLAILFPQSPTFDGHLTQQHQDNAISTKKHLAHEAILVDWPAFLSLRISRCLGPHFLDVL